jgi:hypothetical protein
MGFNHSKENKQNDIEDKSNEIKNVENIDIATKDPSNDNTPPLPASALESEGGKNLLQNKVNRSEEQPEVKEINNLDNFSFKKKSISSNVSQPSNKKDWTCSQIVREKDKLKKQIENLTNELNELEEFESAKKEISKRIRQSICIKNGKELGDNEKKNIIREEMDNYWNENEKKLMPIFQSLPLKSKKNILRETQKLEEMYTDIYVKNKQVHEEIKCEKCFTKPIIGNRYICRICQNYNLCEKCYKKNQVSQEHNHQFIKFKSKALEKIEEENENCLDIHEDAEKNNNGMKEIDLVHKKDNDKINNYSYKCITKDLKLKMKKGTREVSFKLELENNGSSSWPENKTFLEVEISKSNINTDKIILSPLKPGDKCDVDILFKHMSKINPGKFQCCLSFILDDKKYGNDIDIEIEVYDEDSKNFKSNSVIVAFRDEYGIKKDIISDDDIYRGLIKHQTFENAYKSIIKNI